MSYISKMRQIVSHQFIIYIYKGKNRSESRPISTVVIAHVQFSSKHQTIKSVNWIGRKCASGVSFDNMMENYTPISTAELELTDTLLLMLLLSLCVRNAINMCVVSLKSLYTACEENQAGHVFHTWISLQKCRNVFRKCLCHHLLCVCQPKNNFAHKTAF